jgi:hypothetical protein
VPQGNYLTVRESNLSGSGSMASEAGDPFGPMPGGKQLQR